MFDGLRIQFPIRAMFIVTTLCAVLLVVGRFVLALGMPTVWSGICGLVFGVTAGLLLAEFARPVLAIMLVVTALLFATLMSNVLVYALAYAAGGLLAWKGLLLCNWFFDFCGIAESRSPTRAVLELPAEVPPDAKSDEPAEAPEVQDPASSSETDDEPEAA